MSYSTERRDRFCEEVVTDPRFYMGMPVSGVAGLALLIIADASGGAFALRKRS